MRDTEQPIGWNVYAVAPGRSVTESPQFLEFIPNEPALNATSAHLTDEVERHLEDGTL